VTSLGEDLPKEQARVRELIAQYRDPILKGSGFYAAAMMEEALRYADYAVVSGDVVVMIRAYEMLKGFSN
jgi:hypothetical protein